MRRRGVFRQALGGLLRFIGLWLLPPLVLVILLLAGATFWVLDTPAGTRWALQRVAAQLEGRIDNVRGSVLRGLEIGALDLPLPDGGRLQLQEGRLNVAWRELLERRLHVRTLSADRLSLALSSSGDETESEAPLAVPALPVVVQVDQLNLGHLEVKQDGEPLPVAVDDLQTRLTVGPRAAALALHQVQLRQDATTLSLHGDLQLHQLEAPWDFDLNLRGQAQGSPAAAPGEESSPVCLHDRVAGLEAPAESSACEIDLQVQLFGTLDTVWLRARAAGQGLQWHAVSTLYPLASWPLGDTRMTLTLPQAQSLEVRVRDEPAGDAARASRSVRMQMDAHQLHLNPWLPSPVGASTLDLQARLQLEVEGDRRVREAGLQLDVRDGTQWNGHPLSGKVHLDRLARTAGPLFDPAETDLTAWLDLVVSGFEADLALGQDRIRADADISRTASRVALDARLPTLATLWPGLAGGAGVQLQVAGSPEDQKGTLKADFQPQIPPGDALGEAPVHLSVGFSGGVTEAGGWRGALSDLRLSHAGLLVQSQSSVPLSLTREAAWHVGQATLALSLNDEPLVQLQHEDSSGAGAQWASRGHVQALEISPARIWRVQRWLGVRRERDGRVRDASSRDAWTNQLTARLAWNVRLEDALTGDIQIETTGGSLTVPGDVPVTLTPEKGALAVTFRRVQAGLSEAQASLQLSVKDRGSLQVEAGTPIHAAAGAGITVRPADRKWVRVRAESQDLAWVNLFLGGALEVGGTIQADVRAESHPDGRWSLSGPLSGTRMSLVDLDQGVRLLDGTLRAHFDGLRLVLDSLRFPAVRRVTPKEWRTATWISEEPDAQDGYLELTGQWDLAQQAGEVGATLHRYPILQRSDRYAMITGNLSVEATLPKIRIDGQIQADAGWFDLDMLSNVPSLDSDVVVKRADDDPLEAADEAPLDLLVDLQIDMGPRFYLTGFGVDAGLVGKFDLHMEDGRLTALGALRTRGGAIDIYGQHLQLRRGTVTFQGDIANPVLDVEALRTGVEVQAGVRVAGTARRPRIDLVSYPDVDEAAKLTWLLLGHGPDDGGGGDMALLFSVGTSFLAQGEPFYRRFGLDELSMRSGELGSTGSILPVESVVSGLDTGASPIEQRFVRAGKVLGKDLRVSLEQALAQTGTLARLSYRIMWRLQAEVTAGTVNGLALVYRWFSRD